MSNQSIQNIPRLDYLYIYTSKSYYADFHPFQKIYKSLTVQELQQVFWANRYLVESDANVSRIKTVGIALKIINVENNCSTTKVLALRLNLAKGSQQLFLIFP